jgi:sec-independent protein translocase protein TatC
MSSIEDIMQHLRELRKRILRIAIVIGGIFLFIISFHLVPVEISGIQLYYPTPDPVNNIAAQITTFMKNSLVPEGVQLIQTQPGQAFFAQIYVGALVALVLGMPIIIREIVAFIKPALKERENKISRNILLPALGLFVLGSTFAYYFVIPYILEFLYTYGESSGLLTFLNIMDFITFVLQFLIAFGLSFELPLIMYAVNASGIVSNNFWRKYIRYAVIVIVIFGAIITPDGSGVTMWFVAGPMMGLYLIGMVIIERKGSKKLNI